MVFHTLPGSRTVMAQNAGAGENGRVRRTFIWGMILETAFGLAVGVVLYAAAGPIIRLFSRDPDVIEEGIRFTHLIAVFYPLPALTNGIQGYFRGIGKLRVTLVSFLINIGTRVLSCWWLLFHLHGDFASIPWSYMIGWVCMLLCEVPVVLYTMHRRNPESRA